MKVLFLNSVHPILESRLAKLGFTCEHDYKAPKEKILDKIANYEGLVIRSRMPIDKEFINAATQLKFIARSGAGLENIDLKAAQKNKIHLIAAPEGNRQAVGEHALGMILNLFNNISIADQEIRTGKWNREKNRGVELAGKTIGIIGYGNMGKAFAKCVYGFNCEVIAFDNQKTGFSDDYACEVSLEQIYNQADIISFHTPYLKDTHHYLNTSFINRMTKPFYIINTARGKIVNTDDLVNGLKSNKILGACLDVLEYEKSSFEDMFDKEMPDSFKYLVESQKVLLSPHVAGWTKESYEKLSTVLADKIQDLYTDK